MRFTIKGTATSAARHNWCRRNDLLLVAFILISNACLAADSKNEDLLNLSLDELGSVKIDTVFAASKFTQKVTDAPSSVTIVTRDDIDRFGYRTLADIIRSVRSFDVTYDRNYSYTGVRGFNGLGDYGARVLLLIDGHRTNELIFNTSAVGTDALLDVDLIERVEFIRGPGSAIYGSNAFFAVINIVTRTGAAVSGAELSGSIATYDTYSGRFTLGEKLKNGIEFMISGTNYSSAGAGLLFYPEFRGAPGAGDGVVYHHDGDRFWNLYGSVSWADFTLAAGYDERVKDVPTAAFGGAFGRMFTTWDARGFTELRYAHQTQDGWQLAGRLYYDTYDYHTSEEFAGDPGFIVNNDYARARWWGGEASVGQTFLDRVRLTLGTEFRVGSTLEIGNYDVQPFFLYQKTNADEQVFSLYAQSDTDILKNLRLSAGLRWDNYSTFGDTVNPRVGLIYNPWQQTVLKLLYGTAFRAPNIYEEKLDSPAYKPPSHLDPEHIKTYELVAEQYFLTNWRASVSAYYNDVSDLIDSKVDPSDGLLTFQNLNSVEMKGAEVELEGKWANGFRVGGSYARQHVEDSDTGEILPNSPRNVVKTHVSVPVWRDKLFASVEFLYTSDRITLRQNHSGDAEIVNTTLFSREILPNLECSISVYNVFDQKYRFLGSTEHAQDTIPQDGRTLRLKATYKF
jgi:outer membrane cobalamin receptor